MANTEKFLTRRQLQERYAGKSHMFIEGLIRNDPTFPRPIKPGSGESAHRLWSLSEIESWEKTKISGRSARALKTTDGGEIFFDQIVSMSGGPEMKHVVATLKDGKKVELVARNINEAMAS